MSVVLLAALALGAARTDGTPRVAPATVEMAALLKERAAAVDPLRTAFVVNQRRAELLARALAEPRPGREPLRLRGLYAIELLNSAASVSRWPPSTRSNVRAGRTAPRWRAQIATSS